MVGNHISSAQLEEIRCGIEFFGVQSQEEEVRDISELVTLVAQSLAAETDEHYPKTMEALRIMQFRAFEGQKVDAFTRGPLDNLCTHLEAASRNPQELDPTFTHNVIDDIKKAILATTNPFVRSENSLVVRFADQGLETRYPETLGKLQAKEGLSRAMEKAGFSLRVGVSGTNISEIKQALGQS